MASTIDRYSYIFIAPELMRTTDRDVPLHGDGKCHVDGGAEGDGGHGIEEVDVELGEEGGHGDQVPDHGERGVSVDWNICHNIPAQLQK